MSRPRLFFSAEEVAVLRTRAETTHAALWAELQAYCERHLADQPPAALQGENYDQKGWYLEEHFLSRIVNCSLASVISQDPRALDTAKRWLMTLTRMPEWEGIVGGGQPDAGLYTQFGQIALAAGYDWLYDELSPEEREAIRAKMAYVAGQVYRAAHGGEWWSGAYWHHDMILPVTGLGIAAVTLLDEDPHAPQWLERAREQVNLVLDRIGDDGAWHEGAACWSWGTMTLLIFADMLERRTGQSLWERPWIRETAWYRLYAWLPPDRVVNFDDAHPSGSYGTLTKDHGAILYRLAHQYDNPYAQWLGDLEAAAKQSEFSIAWRFLWRDASLEPKAPDLPWSRFFENQDLVISRAGWGEHDPVVAFTCGATVGRRALAFGLNPDGSPNQGLKTGSNHTHPDQLSFMVYANGDYLVAPRGYGYYSAEDENSILIDGKGPRHYAGGSTDALVEGGRLEQVSFAAGRDSMVGQAAACYPHDLGVKQAERQLTYEKPNTVTISDTIVLTGPHDLEWRFQAGDGVHIEPRGSDFWFVGKHASLKLSVLTPADLQITIQQGGRHRWDQEHQWLSVRWPGQAAEAKAQFLLEMVGAQPAVPQ